MKSYPSIPTFSEYLKQLKPIKFPAIGDVLGVPDVIVFDKLDGSQIRVEWSAKRGFYKFGSKTQLLTEQQGIIYQARALFLAQYTTPLQKILTTRRMKTAVLFMEFHGPSSFAGGHSTSDQHELTLFDIAENKRGMLPPKEFIKAYNSVPIPKILHQGYLSEDILDEIKNGTLEGMGFEGVVCKLPQQTRPGFTTAFKIKRQDWYDALQIHCAKLNKDFNLLK